MNNLIGLSSGLKSLDKLRSLSGASNFGSSKAISISPWPSSSSSDLISLGSFANLKLIAEKLVKEQASSKTDLDLANSKLKKLTEHIHVLEEKLQNAFNENAKLKVRQKEDEKLWGGLESKFSSTKVLCDQLTETLQHLAGRVQDAEKDKEVFENKLSASSVALDNLHVQMKSLSLRLESSDEAVKNCEKELQELSVVKEEMEKSFRDERCRSVSLNEEKDTMIKKLEETIESKALAIQTLTSKMEGLQLELRLKEDDFKHLMGSKEKLDCEKTDLLSCNQRVSNKLDMAQQEIKNLEEFVNFLAASLTELDNQSLAFVDKVMQLNTLYASCIKLAQEERDLGTQLAQRQYDRIRDQFLHATSEKDTLELVNQDLKNRVNELQKEQEYAMVQHAEECRLAEERIRSLESKAESVLTKKTEMETMIITLEEKLQTTSENAQLSAKRMEELLLKVSELEIVNKDNAEKLQAEIQKKEEDINVLQKEIEKHEQNFESHEKQVNQFQNISEEKDRLILQYKDREKQLEDQKAEIHGLLTEAESKLAEAKKQHDQLLESKQLELSRRLKEISHKNDQAINDIRRKYEVEKLESIKVEKEKAGKGIEEVERKCDQKLAECKEESKQYLMGIQEEQASLITRIRQEHDTKEANLIQKNSEELKRVQLQAENELREKTLSVRKEHDAQLRALRDEHEDECRKLQEELDLQRVKEERQRALLQLQWKVMGDNQQDDQEVDSKKNYSISATKMRNSGSGKRDAMVRAENEEKNSPYLTAESPVSYLMKKVENGNRGSVMSIPKHSQKVTRREYEVETSNGRMITKRRKTKSTVMFEDPRKNQRRKTPKVITPRDVKGIKGDGHPKPSNIGDLFSEGSLNPYVDDPYAF